MSRRVKASVAALNGQVVEFRLSDVHFPDQTIILHALHDGELLTGRVVELSRDAHRAGDLFVGVSVDGLRQRCYVSADRVRCVVQRAER